MNPTKLNEMIQIERQTVTLDSVGGQVSTWEVIAQVWARVIPVKGIEQIKAGRAVVTQMATFQIRYFAGLLHQDRISYASKKWNISSIVNIGQNDGLEISAEAQS